MMLFVPVVQPTENMTPRARDLTARVAKAVDEFRRCYPDTTNADIRAALARAGTSYGRPRRIVAVAAAAAGIGVVGILTIARSGTTPSPMLWTALAAAIGAIVATLARASRRG